jgi:hypothetical protein
VTGGEAAESGSESERRGAGVSVPEPYPVEQRAWPERPGGEAAESGSWVGVFDSVRVVP